MGKLNKIISLSGATRYEELNENVTHVVVGKRNDKELKAFQDMNKEYVFCFFLHRSFDHYNSSFWQDSLCQIRLAAREHAFWPRRQ